MKKNTKLLLVITSLLTVFLIMSCKTTSYNTIDKTKPFTLIIGETTDIHGSVFPYDFIDQKETNHSLAHVMSWVKETREKDENLILLDNGDFLQGQPTVYYSNFETPNKKHIISKMYNYMGYDAASVGNHDIEAGHGVYDKLNKEFKFPWLAANAVHKETREPYFQPYTIIDRYGIKIAVIGMVTPNIPHWLPENLWEGLEFEDMIESAQKWIKVVKEEEKADIVIGLFHAGIDYTYGGASANTYKNENASKLVAQQVNGFDIIFAGHDHQTTNELTENGVLLMGTTSAGKEVAKATLVIEWDETNQKWSIAKKGEIVSMEDYDADPNFMKKFSKEYKTISNYVSKIIGNFKKSITTREAMFKDSPFVDLIHNIQLDLTDADVSFAAPLSFDKTINKGNIYVSDMFKLYKYENLLYTMKLSGKEIKDYLEYSYGKWFNQMKNADDHIINFQIDDNGKPIYSERYNSYQTVTRYYNYDSAAGIKYTVNVSKPVGERINIISMANGENFDINKEYVCAINSYRGNGGGGHLTEGVGLTKDKIKARMVSSTLKDLRYYLMKWIEDKFDINPITDNNWKVIPEKWFEKAYKTDFKMLYK